MSSTIKGILALVVIVVVLGGWYLGRDTTPAQTGPIKIGFIAPLTGDAASIGESMRNAVMIAVDEVNAAGGINGRPVEMIYEDGKCGTAAADAAQKLINVDGVHYILGGACSGETLAAAPIAERRKVILLSAVSSSPEITTAGDYIFRNFASDASSGDKIAQIITAKGYTTVAVIAEQTDYSQALKKVFEQKYASLGGSIVASEGYSTTNKDFRTLIAKVKASDAQALYLIPQTPATGEILLQQIKSSGLSLPKFSNELVTTASFLKSGISEGIIYAEVGFDKEAPASKNFFDTYLARFNSIDANTPPVYLASQYDAAKILFEQIAKQGDDVEKVKQGLYGIKGRVGAASTVTMDSNGDAILEYVLKVIKNGKSEAYTQ
jgi:branched-chain amino acid transport system substrate-binding protein